MGHYLIFMLLGYLSGSILYAYVFGYLFMGRNIVEESRDNNPGTANAFMYGSFACGAATLCCDLLKGFLPVYLCMHANSGHISETGLALVMAAPVLGHIFPVFYNFRGGKGIAVTFGCFLALFPDLLPAGVLAFFFILFSLVIRITPHFYRTISTYLFAAVTILFSKERQAIQLAYLLITGLVCYRLHLSEEEKEKFRVRLLWKH